MSNLQKFKKNYKKGDRVIVLYSDVNLIGTVESCHINTVRVVFDRKSIAGSKMGGVFMVTEVLPLSELGVSLYD